MQNDVVTFGRPDRFQLSLAWADAGESVARLPKEHGWSMGRFGVSVAGHSLTAHLIDGHRRDHVLWYLGPLLHWFADNWVPLFHEEHFPWPERSEDGAAAVCSRAIARFASIDHAHSRFMAAADAWYRRHGLASASAGGLFPDIYLRRFGDDVELSWTGAPPPFAPNEFTFETEPGLARLAVGDVAEPLFAMLTWVKSNAPALETPAFRANWQLLVNKIEALADTPVKSFNAADIAEALLARVQASFHACDRDDLLVPERAQTAPYIVAEAPAVAMFGGVSVDLSDMDIGVLRDALIKSANGNPSERLRDLAQNTPLIGKPWQDGYDLAEDLLDRLEDDDADIAPNGYVDIRGICRDLGIDVHHQTLGTRTIRGVALAGEGFAPSILVNNRSTNNLIEDGRRFTIAHELCHILHDQSRARRLAHTSGPWASPAIEKRANAFAAWLLMPPRLLRQHFDIGQPVTYDGLLEIAQTLHVANTALAEHMFNLSLIDEVERDELRAELRAELHH